MEREEHQQEELQTVHDQLEAFLNMYDTLDPGTRNRELQQIQESFSRAISTNRDQETTTEKGNRHENEAKVILKRVFGAGVEKVDGWGNHDPFGFIDLIAINTGTPVKFIQVKTNGFTTKDKQKYQKRTRHLPHSHAIFEVWVRHDQEGWVIYRYREDDEFEKKYTIPYCNTSEAREYYHEIATSTPHRDRGTPEDYPQYHFEKLAEAAVKQFEEQLEDYGAGKNWLQDEPRYHIYKAADELFQARNLSQNGKIDVAIEHYGDALNHMLFAIEITSLSQSKNGHPSKTKSNE